MKTLRQIAAKLTAQCLLGAGFYTSAGRRFGARVRGGALQVLVFDQDGKLVWEPAAPGAVRDHNGRQLLVIE